jgi:glycosyltransferase involved in cell wall biosynthesis
LSDAVTDLGKTPIDELPLLYGGAEAVVYASLWEGFGMPIIEAMACGTPVITSNVAAMPETAGGAALLVDPNSPGEIAAAMSRIASDVALCASLRVRGLERARQFSWDRTARETLTLYREVLEN